jgi:hypothetical protein
MTKASRKVIYGLSWILIFAVYFSAELILRVYYIHGDGNSKEQMESWANKLPGFLTDSLKSQQRTEEAEKELEEALKTDDQKKIIAAYFKLAYEMVDEEQAKIFITLYEKYPDDFSTRSALIHTMSEDHEKYNYDYVTKYAEKFSRQQQQKIYSEIWSKVNSFKAETQELYLKAILTKKFVSSDFFYIYESLQSLSFKLKMPSEIDDQIDALKAKCLAKVKQENSKNKKGKK